MILCYEDWYDKVGNDLETEIDRHWVYLPNVFTRQFSSSYYDDKVQDALIEAYENYVSEYEDMAYERARDERLGLC